MYGTRARLFLSVCHDCARTIASPDPKTLQFAERAHAVNCKDKELNAATSSAG